MIHGRMRGGRKIYLPYFWKVVGICLAGYNLNRLSILGHQNSVRFKEQTNCEKEK